MKNHTIVKPSCEPRIIGWLSIFGTENLKKAEFYGKIIIESEKEVKNVTYPNQNVIKINKPHYDRDFL